MAGTDNHNSRGSGSEAMRKRRAEDAVLWEKMLKQINQTKPQTMLGYGLGKLLRGAWDHYWDRKAEKAAIRDSNGNIVARANNEPYTYSIDGNTVDPRTATVDASNTIYGIAPTKGLLGDEMMRGYMANTPTLQNPVALTAGQTKQTVEDSEGNKQTTTTETPVYTLQVPQQPERLTLPQMVARQLVEGNPFGMNDKKTYLGNINFPY